MIREMNDRNVIKDRREKLGLLCYKLPALHMEEYSVCKKLIYRNLN